MMRREEDEIRFLDAAADRAARRFGEPIPTGSLWDVVKHRIGGIEHNPPDEDLHARARDRRVGHV